jgi:hypothetical protein
MVKKDKNLIAYCGLYCPTCYKMVVSGAAQSLKNALKNTHICGSVSDPSKQFKNELNDLISLRCPKVCKKGGGNPNCAIKKCCLSKRVNGCWECDSFKTCKNLTKQFVGNIMKYINNVNS